MDGPAAWRHAPRWAACHPGWGARRRRPAIGNLRGVSGRPRLHGHRRRPGPRLLRKGGAERACGLIGHGESLKGIPDSSPWCWRCCPPLVGWPLLRLCCQRCHCKSLRFCCGRRLLCSRRRSSRGRERCGDWRWRSTNGTRQDPAHSRSGQEHHHRHQRKCQHSRRRGPPGVVSCHGCGRRDAHGHQPDRG